MHKVERVLRGALPKTNALTRLFLPSSYGEADPPRLNASHTQGGTRPPRRGAENTCARATIPTIALRRGPSTSPKRLARTNFRQPAQIAFDLCFAIAF